MVSYFINHTEPRETALREANIPFELFNIRVKGFLIESVHRARTLSVLQSHVVEELDSGYEGIKILTIRRGAGSLEPERREAQVTVELRGRNSIDLHEFIQIAREYAPRLKTQNVVLYDNDQSRFTRGISPRLDPETCTIFFWAVNRVALDGSDGFARAQANGEYTPATLWDYEVSRSRGHFSAWHPSGDGILIRDSRGVAVAEVIGTNIYILYPITHYDFFGNAKVFRKILDECVPLVGMSAEEREAHFAKVREAERIEQQKRDEKEKVAREERKPKARLEYIAACAGRYKKTLAGTQQAIDRGHKEIAELQLALTRKIRETNGAERKLKQMESERSNVEESYAKEFDKLSSLPKVLEILAVGGLVKIYTDTLYCVDPRTKKKHDIGRFEIVIDPAGVVTFKNLTRTVDGFYAPHVSASRGPCLGNIKEVIPELVGNYEFATLTMVCIQYIESVNVDDDWGRRISMWPIAA